MKHRAIVQRLLGAAFLLFMCTGAWQVLSAQVRVAVLPFLNTEGSMDYNERSYQLADTINAVLTEISRTDGSFVVVPPDSVQEIISTLNLDPTNPQYESDVWRAVETLNVDRVVSGAFNVKYGKIIINANVFDVKTKLADQVHAAKSIYKAYDKTFEAIPAIIKAILPAVNKKQ